LPDQPLGAARLGIARVMHKPGIAQWRQLHGDKLMVELGRGIGANQLSSGCGKSVSTLTNLSFARAASYWRCTRSY
jgi:hypothetical protein